MDMRVSPPALGIQVTNRLLDLLSTDDAFRDLFVRDTKSALEVAGYVHADSRLPHAALCLMPKTGRLASKEQITAAREKLSLTVNSIHGMLSPFEADTE